MTDEKALTVLVQQVAARLLAMGGALVTAESCTGGWVGKACTDLPGSSQARVLWGTGRGNQQRTGFVSASAAAAALPTLHVRGDLGGDGKDDIVWRKVGAGVDKGAMFLWMMEGTGLAGSRYLDPISEDWQVQGLGDFNGDGKSDILWRNFGAGGDNGKLYVWMVDGPNVIGGTGYTASQADLTWRIDSPRR